ncbi:hypothetical protein D3C71_575720 [compost metagenome]
MPDNLQYRVSSREIIELVSAMRSKRLTRSPFFQRNLVWRETHKREFIETILSGLPFPQIFLARGKINVEAMEAYSCVVDGQQRLTAIEEFIEGKFSAAGKFYSDMTADEKEDFLKYKVAIIDFDLGENDPKLKDIFMRLNRTYYSLSTVEKIASEFSGSEFMVTARVLCGDFQPEGTDYGLDASEQEDNPFLVDPSLPQSTINWAKAAHAPSFIDLISGDKIFSNYEAARQVPLMLVLTMMSTVIHGNYFKRTDKVKEHLEIFNENFDEKNYILDSFEKVGTFVAKAKLNAGNFWLRKANFFTLAVEVAKSTSIHSDQIFERLANFGENPPERYILAQREAVNSRQERVLRGSYFREYILEGDEAVLSEGPWLERLLSGVKPDDDLENEGVETR